MISIIVAAVAFLFPSISPAQKPIGGTLHLEGGKTQHFAELISLVFSLPEQAESIPQNVNEWPAAYDSESVSRSVPLSWLRSIEVLQFELKEGYRCLFNVVLSIETVSGVVIESRLKTMEWIRIKTAQGEEQTVYFAAEGKIQIRKIVLRSK